MIDSKNPTLKLVTNWICILFFISVLIYLFFSTLVPFRGHDTALYSLIGKALFEGIKLENLPFEHKPFGLSLIYGFFGKYIKYGHGQNLIISIFFNTLFLIFAMLLINSNKFEFQKKNINKIISLFVCLIIFHSPFEKFTGNSETIANVFIISSLFFLFIGTDKIDSRLSIFISGILAICAININYLSGPILSLPSLYLIFKSKKIYFFKAFYFYFIGVLIGCLFVFLYFWLTDSNLFTYYSDLSIFAKKYASLETLKTRFRTFIFFTRWLIIFSPILIYAIFRYRTFDNFISDKRIITLLLWVCTAFLSILASGRQFEHYFSLVIAPIIIISSLQIMSIKFKKFIIVYSVPILICLSYFILDFYSLNIEYNHFYTKKEYGYFNQVKKIKSVIKKEPVLSIKAGLINHYLLNFKVKQKYIFTSHAGIIYGSNEDNYWLKELDKDFEFVIIEKSICSNTFPKTCDFLYKFYKKIHSVNSAAGISGFSSFDLYQKKIDK